jgi:hypothetical protein
MNDLLKFGLIAAGAYMLYEYFYGSTSTSTAASTTSGTTTAQQQVNTQVATQTLQKIMNDMTANNDDPTQYHSVYQWNYYYQRARGVNGPDPNTLFPGANPSKLYSIQEWWTAMNGAGFSGFGLIATRINPYMNPKGTPFGANITANGSERASIVRG